MKMRAPVLRKYGNRPNKSFFASFDGVELSIDKRGEVCVDRPGKRTIRFSTKLRTFRAAENKPLTVGEKLLVHYSNGSIILYSFPGEVYMSVHGATCISKGFLT